MPDIYFFKTNLQKMPDIYFQRLFFYYNSSFMNTNLALQSPIPYEFYFGHNSTVLSTNTNHNKENVPDIKNKTRYQFYFKKPSLSIQQQQPVQKQIPLKVRSEKVLDSSFTKAISNLIDYTQMTSLSFQSFLGAAIIYFKLKQKTQINQNQSSAIALSCLFISLKLNEIQQLSVVQMSQMTGNKISKEEVLSFEGWILEKLEFDLYLDQKIQNSFENTFIQAISSDKEAIQKAQLLIQMCLLRGNQILIQRQYIQWIGKFVIDESSALNQLDEIQKYFKELKSSYELKSLLLKWSFKIDTDSIVQKLQI